MRKKRLKEIAGAFQTRLRQSDLNHASVSFAYFFMLSLFPMLLVIGTLLPYFNLNAEVILRYMESLIPLPIMAVIEPVVLNLLTTPKGGLLSLGIFTLLWSASAGIKHLKAGIESAYGLTERRFFLVSRLMSIFAFIIVVLLLLIFTIAFTWGEPILESLFHWLDLDTVLNRFLILKWAGTFLSLFALFMMIYRVTPNIRQRLRDVLPGALFATAGLTALVRVYALYLSTNRTLTAYGVLGAFFVLMIWLRLLGYIIFLGAVLNATLYERRYGRPKRFRNSLDRLLDSAASRARARIRDGREDDSAVEPENGLE